MLNPIDVKITKDDFDKNECQKILDEMSKGDYYSMHCAFLQAANKAKEQKNLKQEKIYQLLFQACTMMLEPTSPAVPFKPLGCIPPWTAALDDFTEEDINFFLGIIPDICDIKLKARLADLVWVKFSKKGIKNALIAIDSYCQLPLKAEEVIMMENIDCWHRAISLGVMLGKGADNRVEKISNDIYTIFNSATEENYFALQLARLMLDAGIKIDTPEKIARKLELLAHKLKDNKRPQDARRYFEMSIKWHELMQDKEQSIPAKIALADNFVGEAKYFSEFAESPSSIAVAHFYEKAFNLLRNIPKVLRKKHKIDNRITEIRNALSNARKLIPSEMISLPFGKVDISEQMKAARMFVSGKTPIGALKIFANIHQGAQICEWEKEAMNRIRKNPSLSDSLSSNVMSRDGRVIAKVPGSASNENLAAHHPRVQLVIMEIYTQHMGAVSQTLILPALTAIHAEHRMREIDFLNFVTLSSIIPPEREILFAKGLFAGYNRDYITALHILAPQVENMIRYHLNNAGATTTTLNDGIENLNGLNTLIALPEMKKLCGDDVAFEIKALFCDPLGENFRNEIAHGIVDGSACNSLHAVYAWWFVFRLVLNSLVLRESTVRENE